MRITGLALVLALLAQAACLAETPETARPEAGPLLGRGRLFNNQNWWTRFGEPVNATALAVADGAKGDIAPVAMYGHDYVYGPGSCDCPPPCIDQLWNGYYQHPKRCDGYVPLFGGRHCGDCGDCGCGKGHCGLFGHGKGCGCGDSIGCTTKAACGCSAPIGCTASVPDCGCKPACGCKHAHLGHKWKGFFAHWNCGGCDSCSAPLGCGCATPIAPEVQIPSEKQALIRPSPIPDEATLIALPRLN